MSGYSSRYSSASDPRESVDAIFGDLVLFIGNPLADPGPKQRSRLDHAGIRFEPRGRRTETCGLPSNEAECRVLPILTARKNAPTTYPKPHSLSSRGQAIRNGSAADMAGGKSPLFVSANESQGPRHCNPSPPSARPRSSGSLNNSPLPCRRSWSIQWAPTGATRKCVGRLSAGKCLLVGIPSTSHTHYAWWQRCWGG